MTTHKLQPYYRPRSMGGDVAHPLCLAPVTGWAGPKLATFPMTTVDRRVDCPSCLRHMANGGIASRVAEQAQRLARREAPVEQLGWPMSLVPAPARSPQKALRQPALGYPIGMAVPMTTMCEIARTVGARHGVTLAEMRARRRNTTVDRARIEAMALCYDAGKTNAQVGAYFGGRDHSTTTRARRVHASRQAAAMAMAAE